MEETFNFHFSLKYHKYSRVLFTASDNLDYMITELGTIIRKRERIPPANIDAIVNCISANTSEEQSIILLQSCHNARHEPNQALLITRIWDELRQHKHLLNYENQKTMLKHFSFHGNVAEAQTYFDQLTQTGYRHNSLVSSSVLYFCCCFMNELLFAGLRINIWLQPMHVPAI